MAENCSSAVCMSSAISCANTSGSGKSSDSTSTTVTSVRSRTNRGPLLVRFRDVLRLKLTTQADRGLSALGSHFDLHVPVTLIETSASAPMQVLCQRSFHGIDGVFCLPETTELSGILTFRKKATIAPWVNARPTRCQHLEAGSPFVTTRRGG